MRVKFIDLTRQNKIIQNKVLEKYKKIIISADFILGKEVFGFEKAFAKFLKVPHCIGVASGTDGILLSLMALGIGKDDEVIVPAFTFTATITPIMQLGAKPILVDTLENIPLIDTRKIESVITKKTKAIVVVHLYGIPCEMDKIKQIAKKYKIKIIEDAAQGHGSMYKNKLVGTIGDIGVFSFYPTKNLGAFGDAGAIVTSNTKLANKLIMLRNHGQTEKNQHKILGVNSRLDSLQAAVLQVKLPLLRKQNIKRKQHAVLYRKLLKDLSGILLPENFKNQTNNHIFAIRTKQRDLLRKYLNNQDIETALYYPIPVHLQKFYTTTFGNIQSFPFAENLSKELLALPMYPELTDLEIKKVSDNIKNFFAKK